MDEYHNILAVSKKLAEPLGFERDLHLTGRMPSLEQLTRFMRLVKAVIFPDFYAERTSLQLREHYLGVNLDELITILSSQISSGLCFVGRVECDETHHLSRYMATQFVESLPEIKRLLFTDVEAMYRNDPAVSGIGEIIYSYPVIRAMIHYRVAHRLLTMGVPVIPRVITEMAHSRTGIDIHPGARIGEYFAIDHGTGVVIGQTCIIGNHVTLYQGVTLGAKNFEYDSDGHPMDVPRHPIIEDNVTIYSNSSVLGRITVGHHSVIGGNVWLTESVAPYSRITQVRPAKIE